MPQQSIQLCREGARLNQTCRLRTGNVVHLPETGKLVVAGDLHGHRRNFERIQKFADLEHHPSTHVVLQEIIHGGPEDDFGGCLSYKLLFDAIQYKIRFPDQVHILLGNHDTAMICNSAVMKAGREMNRISLSSMMMSIRRWSSICCRNRWPYVPPIESGFLIRCRRTSM
jgi:hypothetical protein